jgi:restriction system protein
MPFPKQTDIEIPLLQVIHSMGGIVKPKEIYHQVAKYFPDLTLEEQNQIMESKPSGKKWWNIVQWARQTLVVKKELDGSTRGVWKITPIGIKRIESIGKKVKISKHPDVINEITLRDLVNENNDQIKSRLITELKSLTPRSFEKFCTVLLEQLGYEDLSITNRGSDGGVDGYGNFRQGVVRINSAFQAKKWDDKTVSRPEIDKFRGSIQGDYDHGVFLTTSRFSKDAQEASVKKGAITILLLDGLAISNLMIEKGIGVHKQLVYLSDVDDEFFDFDEE